MSDGNSLRIEHSNLISENQLPSPFPVILKSKKTLEDKGNSPFSSTSSLEGAKNEEALFPNIKISEPLSERECDINFNRSFLHEKPSEQLIQDQKQIIQTQDTSKYLQPVIASEPLLNFNRRFYDSDSELSEFEKKLLASDLGSLVKIASQVIDMRMDEQKEALKSFKLSSEKLRHLRGKKAKLLDDLAENAKLEDYWSSVLDMVSYLSIGIGVTTGLGTFALGVYTGNLVFINSGMLSLLGGIGNFASQWMNKKKYNEKYSKAVNLVSILLVAYGAFNTYPSLLNMKKVDMVKNGLQAVGTTSQTIAQSQLTKMTAEQYNIQSANARIQHHHEKNKAKLTKVLGSLKLEELMNELKAASKQLGEEDKLKERIAQILSSAV